MGLIHAFRDEFGPVSRHDSHCLSRLRCATHSVHFPMQTRVQVLMFLLHNINDTSLQEGATEPYIQEDYRCMNDVNRIKWNRRSLRKYQEIFDQHLDGSSPD